MSARSISPRGFLIAGHVVFLVVLVARVWLASLQSAAAAGARGVSAIMVLRWTGRSAAFATGIAAVLVVLAAGPFVFSPGVTERLTALFVYVILGAMWNALAGYGGLVSVGQQAFFGLGAFAAIRLSYAGVPVYASLALAALLVGRAGAAAGRGDAAPARRRVRDRHVGGGGTRASAGQSRSAGATARPARR